VLAGRCGAGLGAALTHGETFPLRSRHEGRPPGNRRLLHPSHNHGHGRGHGHGYGHVDSLHYVVSSCAQHRPHPCPGAPRSSQSSSRSCGSLSLRLQHTAQHNTTQHSKAQHIAAHHITCPVNEQTLLCAFVIQSRL
jgi:hypothetical protein